MSETRCDHSLCVLETRWLGIGPRQYWVACFSCKGARKGPFATRADAEVAIDVQYLVARAEWEANPLKDAPPPDWPVRIDTL